MTLMSLVSSPFRNTYKYLQRSAHERPIVFYSILIGAIGPVAVIAVPRIRASYGWEPAEKIPISYPLPNRGREPVEGYDDE